MRKKMRSVVALIIAAACFFTACSGGLTKVTGTVIEENFDGSTKYWRENGDCKVTVSNGEAVISDRKTSNAGIEFPCDAFRGNTINVTVFAKSANPTVRISLRYEIYGNISYVTIAETSVLETSYLPIIGDITIPANASDPVVYIEATDVMDISVKSVKIEVTGDYNDLTSTPVDALQDPSGYESLKDLYSDYFM